eukprot:CAMPEP_0201603818 /NCGR_PEP_ID=MMETSP0492-20130828/4150_1 /ASSEMBLY_ACC=CAM_ASM_000837 /TAXON_ID=420259 /ORGANISM="Thalassiosira gravida, Strain GMp14c1" /LENGTH=326 /DNA_ID=CAMNT_0048067693 /DNA_START=138 /DNA_END=1118 /DNA_ORIENTATION=+
MKSSPEHVGQSLKIPSLYQSSTDLRPRPTLMDESNSKPEGSKSQPPASHISPPETNNTTVKSKKRRNTNWDVNPEEIRCSDWAMVPKSTPRKIPPEHKAAYKELQIADTERSSADETLGMARQALEDAKRHLLWAEERSEEANNRFHVAREEVEVLDIQRPDFKWNEMFAKLVEFKERHGHCRIPASDPEFAKLRTFVRGNKVTYREYQSGRRCTNRAHRMIALERLGVFTSKWEEKYNELVEFKKVHGHCNVPTKSKENQKLGNWVGWQRVGYRKCKAGKENQLSEERIKLLEDIGFCFNVFEANGIVRKRRRKEAEEAVADSSD